MQSIDKYNVYLFYELNITNIYVNHISSISKLMIYV